MKKEAQAGYKKLCSESLCLNEAVQLEPRHLCADCLKKEKKHGNREDPREAP